MTLYRVLFKDRSLWIKFSLAIVLPIFLAAAFLVLHIIESVEKSMLERTRSATEEMTRQAALSLSNASAIYNKTLLDNLVDSLENHPDIPYAMIVDRSDGRILAHSDHRWDGRIFKPSSQVPLNTTEGADEHPAAEVEQLTSFITSDDKIYGTLMVGYSAAVVEKEVDTFLGQVLSMAVLTMVLGLVLAMTLARGIGRPVRVMAAQALKIGAGDFSQRIAYDSGDALGQLAVSFNEMVRNLRDREAQLLAVNSVSERLHQSLDSDTVIRQAVDILARYSEAPAVAVYMWDEAAGHLKLTHNKGFPGNSARAGELLPIEGSLTGLAFSRRELMESQNLDTDPRLERSVQEALARDGFAGGVICLPLLFLDRVMGVVNFFFKKAMPLSEDRKGTFMAIGRTIALALANADYVARIESGVKEQQKAEEALRHSMEEITALNTLARKTNQYLSVEQVINAAMETLTGPLKPDAILVQVREGETLVLRGLRVTGPAQAAEAAVFHGLGKGLSEQALATGRALYSLDIESDAGCAGPELDQSGLCSFAALPLVSGDRVIGVLGLGSVQARDFSVEATFLETLSGQLAVALVNAMLYEEIQKQAAELEIRVAERTAELAVAMEKAKEADRIKSAFMASMSHELRTPLNSIIGFTGILLQQLAGPINEEQGKQMRMVQNSARHLLDLINDVLDISKIEAGQLELSLERFDPAESIRKVVRLIGPLAEKKGIGLVLEIDPNLGAITADRRRVEQILINLVNNAVKFTDQGEVKVRSSRSGDSMVTSVSDTGLGLGAADMSALFKEFRQVDTGLARRYEGTGLGLSICKKLVDMHGGSIWAESLGVGLGSTFSFTLPVTEE
jgi:signal transduction histidine kinase/uncharacterized membrane protein affecting hemolysin expression